MTREERIEKGISEFILSISVQENIGRKTVARAYRTAINSPLAQELQEEEAISFKDWCDDYAWIEDFAEQKTHTNKELYQIYKSSKK
jgi:methylaspartate ammonia-lyase